MSETPEIQLAADIVERYRIASLRPLIESCRAFAREDTLNVAVFGRFKAGKSSFLNHLLRRELLPVGVVPVTSAITEIGYGAVESVTVRYADGGIKEAAVDSIREYVDESRNPGNHKNVALVRVELPALAHFRSIRFVDTPGLESVLAHNTEVSRDWLPKVGLALVAVTVDPPLSQRDVELIHDLNRFTPNVSVLLTKVDLLDEKGRAQVEEYVRAQLARNWNTSIPVFPYSVRAGYEHLRENVERVLLAQAVVRSSEHRESILARKTETLLHETSEYLTVALKSAEAADSERQVLRTRILGQKQSLDDSRLALRLVVRHAAANTRTQYDKILKKRESELNELLLREFDQRFPAWTESLKKATSNFEDWLRPAITAEIARLSMEHRRDFLGPIDDVRRQLSQSLQDFRNRLSERTMETLGVPLRTTEVDIEPKDPGSPDIRIGKVFDREWTLISFFVPKFVVRGIVRNHFRRKIADVVFKNLSRLAFQWEDRVNAALSATESEAIRRLEDIVSTVERVLESTKDEAPRIREDLGNLKKFDSGIRFSHDYLT